MYEPAKTTASSLIDDIIPNQVLFYAPYIPLQVMEPNGFQPYVPVPEIGTISFDPVIMQARVWNGEAWVLIEAPNNEIQFTTRYDQIPHRVEMEIEREYIPRVQRVEEHVIEQQQERLSMLARLRDMGIVSRNYILNALGFEGRYE